MRMSQTRSTEPTGLGNGSSDAAGWLVSTGYRRW